MFKPLRNILRAFRQQTGGNTALTFGLALIPVFGLVGAAVDYSRANATRTAMQAALDSTALMLAREVGSTPLTADQITQKASAYFANLFKRPEAQNVQLVSTFDPATNRMVITASAMVDSTVARVIGVKQVPIGTTSEVIAGLSKKVEIALVLDNTGSMATSGKIDALKSASHQFLTDLQKMSTAPDSVRVAIIPFDTKVMAGTSYATKPWIDWSYIDNSAGGDDDDDDIREGTSGGIVTTWKGCFTDRRQPYDTQDTTPTTDAATWFPAVDCDLPVMQPLTSDWTKLHAKVDQMMPKGKTNLTIGLVWGWHALTPNEPMTEAGTSNQIVRYLVFLTDGLNTQNRWTTRPADIDARTAIVCTNVKATGIKVFTIRVLEGNEALLRACASDPSMYYNVTVTSQLSGVFSAILNELTRIRIAR